MNYSFHHIHLICKDLDTMIHFFSEALGADLVKRRKFGTADGATLNLGSIGLNLRVAREGEEITENNLPSAYGCDHIGLEVDSIQAAFEDLTRRGYPFFVPPTESGDMTMAFFKGPENITIELVQTSK